MSRSAQDHHVRRVHKCYDCATLVGVELMYCTPCRTKQEKNAYERDGQ